MVFGELFWGSAGYALLVSRLGEHQLKSYHMSHSLNSLKGDYIGEYIGNYYRGY